MASLEKLVQMLDRAKNGPSCRVSEWDQRVLPKKVREILKRYELVKLFNPETPVNQDLELADRFFEAGLTLASELGVLCTDTETIIELSKEEILEAIKYAPSELTIGKGNDTRILKARSVEDKTPPLFCTSLSIQVDEELYVPLVQGLVSYKNIDILQGPSIDTVFGSPLFSASPYEVVGGFIENRLRKEALWKAGRPDMACEALSSATTEFGFMSGFAEHNRSDNPSFGITLQPSEMKTNYSSFNKVAATIGFGGYIRSACPSMIGGYSGPVEGSIIANIASELVQFVINQADIGGCSLFDIRKNSVVGRRGLWALTTSVQALSRNTHLITDKVLNQTAGPCTKEILYTTAAGYIAAGVSGMALTTGPRSAGGAIKNYISPLEAWWSADMFKASAGMTLSEANELALYLLPKYEENLGNQPKGKSFTECFDIKTLKPTAEWQRMVDETRIELQNRGVRV